MIERDFFFLPTTHTGGAPMASINWITSFEAALEKAKETGQPVLLDFFNPG